MKLHLSIAFLLLSFIAQMSAGSRVGYVERNDLHYFMCIDSTRQMMLFMDGLTKRTLLGLRDMHGQVSRIADLNAIDSTFCGTAEYVRVLEDGNYFIYEEVEDTCSRLWKFFPDDKRLKHVFTFRNKYQSLKYNWGVEYNPDKHLLLFSEYGNSLDNPLDPQDPMGERELGTKAGATKIWASADDGETWSEYFDFASVSGVYPESFHIHALHYDVNDNVLYATSGDGKYNRGRTNKRLWWTSDGTTWENRDWSFYWGRTNDAYSHAQMISLYADEDFIIAAGDDYNNCIYRIEKQSNPACLKLEKVFFYDTEIVGLITQYAARFRKLSNGMIVTMLIGGDGNGFPRRTRLVGTYDGYVWRELFSGPVETPDDFYIQSGIFEEWNGKLYFLLKQSVNGEYKPRFIEMDIKALNAVAPPKHISVSEASEAPQVIYDILGRQTHKPNKGVSIMPTPKGSTTKILTY